MCTLIFIWGGLALEKIMRKVWDYKDANIELINVKENLDIFDNTILNILRNLIPHEFVVCDDKDSPWSSKSINLRKKMLHL